MTKQLTLTQQQPMNVPAELEFWCCADLDKRIVWCDAWEIPESKLKVLLQWLEAVLPDMKRFHRETRDSRLNCKAVTIPMIDGWNLYWFPS